MLSVDLPGKEAQMRYSMPWAADRVLVPLILAQEIVRPGGLLQVIGLYEGGPLPHSSSNIPGRRLTGGFPHGTSRHVALDRAIRYLGEGEFRVADMISHRFPFQQAPEAYDLLYNRLHEAMGVLLQW